jgi:basic membrane lipoprotein Med (substrate-binding protein (PBP1-ABC) superfamily)
MRKFSILALGPVIVVLLFAGCGSSSSSSSSTAAASKASFCADNAKLDKATNSATNIQALLKDLKENLPTVKDFLATAPAAIKAKAQVLATEAETAIKSGNPSGFGNPKFASAGKAVDSFCGESAAGSTSTTS